MKSTPIRHAYISYLPELAVEEQKAAAAPTLGALTLENGMIELKNMQLSKESETYSKITVHGVIWR